MKAQVALKEYKDALEYVGKIGKPEPHFRPATFGSLHNVELTTEICHQAAPSATNYWKCSHFDTALEQVIRNNFDSLAKQALGIMKAKYEIALISEKEELQKKLAEIDALEAAHSKATAE